MLNNRRSWADFFFYSADVGEVTGDGTPPLIYCQMSECLRTFFPLPNMKQSCATKQNFMCFGDLTTIWIKTGFSGNKLNLI